jgi:heme oxygenase
LALPPYSPDPSTYISGLLHIAPIYTTFESIWQSILDAPYLPLTLKESPVHNASEPDYPSTDSRSIHRLPTRNIPPAGDAGNVCSRTRTLLSHLRLPGLLRSGRLRADIRILTGAPEHQIDEGLEAVAQNGELAAFITHMKQSAEKNPHVLVAYAWVLYMALFSGGRHIRASLQVAGGLGGDFWTIDPWPTQVSRDATSRPEVPSSFSHHRPRQRQSRSHSTSCSDGQLSTLVPGLQFFTFLGDEDGEDLKLEFQQRLAKAETLLTDPEKEDIIQEAQGIFDSMIRMVYELDRVMGTNEDDLATARLQLQHKTLASSRDSVILAQERLSKKTRARTLRENSSQERSSKGGWLDSFAGPVTRTLDALTRPRLKRSLSTEGSQAHVSFNPVVEERDI